MKNLSNVFSKFCLLVFLCDCVIGMPPLPVVNVMMTSLSRRNLLWKWIGGATVGVTIAGETYARLGASSEQILSNIDDHNSKGRGSIFINAPLNWNEIEDVTLVFHGAGGQDMYTDELMKNLKDLSSSITYEAIMDWSDISSNLLQASFNGQRYGRIVASQLVDEAKLFNVKNGRGKQKLKTLHIIGISVGAFAADAAVNQFKYLIGDDSDTHVQLTLLDPFSQRGVIGLNYGSKEFGKSADYAQQFLNTVRANLILIPTRFTPLLTFLIEKDDPVPSTSEPLSNCACFDVTSQRPDEIFGHDWPLVYYSRSTRLGIVPLSQQKPRNSLEVL